MSKLKNDLEDDEHGKRPPLPQHQHPPKDKPVKPPVKPLDSEDPRPPGPAGPP